MFIYIYNLITVTLYVLMTQNNLFLSSELISKWPPRILYSRQCCKEHLPIALQLWEAFSRVTHRVACWVIEQVAPPHHKILTNCSPQWQIRSNFCQLLLFLKLKMQSGVALLFYFAFLWRLETCVRQCVRLLWDTVWLKSKYLGSSLDIDSFWLCELEVEDRWAPGWAAGLSPVERYSQDEDNSRSKRGAEPCLDKR